VCEGRQEFIKKVDNYTTGVLPPPVQLISSLPDKSGRETFELKLNQALNFLGADNNLGSLGIWGMGVWVRPLSSNISTTH